MEAREGIIPLPADLGRKSRNCTGIAGFQLGKGRDVILRRGIVPLLRSQRLESAKWDVATSEDEVANRTTPKIRRLPRNTFAHTDMRAELLVCCFEPRRDVDRVAVGR